MITIDKMVAAHFFDGLSNRKHHVFLGIEGDRLMIYGEQGFFLEHNLKDIQISEPLGVAPRIIRLPGAAHCEVQEGDVLSRLLSQSGYRTGWVASIQFQWRWAMLALLFSLAVVVAGYRWALPAGAKWTAQRIPSSWTAQMGNETLALLDKTMLQPSTLSASEQAEMTKAFEAMQRIEGKDNVSGGGAVKLLFRDGAKTGANALALPNGVIAMTDQLYRLGMQDGRQDEVLGVLAHELGHVEQRHSVRMVIQASVISFVFAWYIGDVGGVLAGIPSTLLELHFSREYEREADAYAAKMMKLNGMRPSALASMLEKLEAEHSQRNQANKDESRSKLPSDGQKSEKPDALASKLGAYLSSHPASRERIEALRALD